MGQGLSGFKCNWGSAVVIVSGENFRKISGHSSKIIIIIDNKYSSDRDTLRVECKSAVFHADFLLLRLSRFGNSTGSDASS